MTAVPASTPVRTKSIPNVETDRLARRLDYLRDHMRDAGAWAEQKNDLRARVREVVNIERELARRDVPFEPVTDGRHLAYDVHTVREVRPADATHREPPRPNVDTTRPGREDPRQYAPLTPGWRKFFTYHYGRGGESV